MLATVVLTQLKYNNYFELFLFKSKNQWYSWFDFFKEEYFFPDGVTKKPSLYLADMLPDLNADSFLLLSNIEYFIISDLRLFI